jgi:anti-sigma regulatory factor (Ser/Thr protein kinase)
MHAGERAGKRIERVFSQRDYLAPSAARGVVREFEELDQPSRDDLAIAISELVANAVRHAPIVDGGEIRLVVETGPDGVRVEVHDPGTGFDATPRHDEGGRGLAIVASVAESWGVLAIKHTLVWCHLSIV